MSSTKGKCKNYVQLAQLVHLMRSQSSYTHYIKLILDRGYDLNYAIPSDSPVKYFEPNWVGNTVLHFAVLSCDQRDSSIVDLLLRQGADFTHKNQNGLTPLLLAFKIGDINLINRLLEAHVTSNNAENPCNNVGLSHFYISCLAGNLKVVDFFLKSGVSTEEPSYSDLNHLPRCTPVHLANRSGNMNVVNLLSQYRDHYKCTIVNGKCSRCPTIQEQIDDSLLLKSDSSSEKSINLSLPCDSDVGEQYINDYLKKMLSVHPKNKQENLKLFYVSCFKDDFGTVERLIKSGIDINAPIDHFAVKYGGYTAMHFAIDGGSEYVIELLLKRGSNITLQDSEGNTPIHLAALKHPRLIKLLLRASEFDLKTRNVLDQTVLDILFIKPSNPRCKQKTECDDFLCLLTKKSFLKSIDVASKLDLIGKMFDRFDVNAFESLIKYIPDVNDVNSSNGRNAIHCVLQNRGHLWLLGDLFPKFVVKLLMLVDRYGCELDCQDKQGRTPLHYAALFDNESTIRALLSIGADVNITDIHGKTPYSYCFKHDITSHAGKVLYSHVHALKCAGLYVHPENDNGCRESLINSSSDLRKTEYEKIKNFKIDLIEMEKINITKGLTLRDVLTDEMVTRFPIMSKNDRQAILDYIDTDDLRLKFSSALPLFNLQRRKALKRCTL